MRKQKNNMQKQKNNMQKQINEFLIKKALKK